MNHTLFTISLGFGALILAAQQLSAQSAQACGSRDLVIERLANAYGETRQSIGLGANNEVVEVFASLTTGTWTITVTSASGRTCLVAAGEAYEPVIETLNPATGEDA